MKPFKYATNNTPFAKYNALRSALSTYLKEEQIKTGSKNVRGKKKKKVTYEGLSFNQAMKKLWSKVKEKNIDYQVINNNFESLMDGVIEMMPSCHYWELVDKGMSQISDDHAIIVDGRSAGNDSHYYTGNKRDFLISHWSDWVKTYNHEGFKCIDLNGQRPQDIDDSDDLPLWLFQLVKKNGVSTFLAVLGSADDIREGLDLPTDLLKKQGLSDSDLKPEDKKPYGKGLIQETEDISKEIPEQKLPDNIVELEKERTKQKEIELQLEKEKTKQLELKSSKENRLIDLLEKGLISNDQFMKLMGL
jgi:hypothetical protein